MLTKTYTIPVYKSNLNNVNVDKYENTLFTFSGATAFQFPKNFKNDVSAEELKANHEAYFNEVRSVVTFLSILDKHNKLVNEEKKLQKYKETEDYKALTKKTRANLETYFNEYRTSLIEDCLKLMELNHVAITEPNEVNPMVTILEVVRAKAAQSSRLAAFHGFLYVPTFGHEKKTNGMKTYDFHFIGMETFLSRLKTIGFYLLVAADRTDQESIEQYKKASNMVRDIVKDFIGDSIAPTYMKEYEVRVSKSDRLNHCNGLTKHVINKSTGHITWKDASDVNIIANSIATVLGSTYGLNEEIKPAEIETEILAK